MSELDDAIRADLADAYERAVWGEGKGEPKGIAAFLASDAEATALVESGTINPGITSDELRARYGRRRLGPVTFSPAQREVVRRLAAEAKPAKLPRS